MHEEMINPNGHHPKRIDMDDSDDTLRAFINAWCSEEKRIWWKGNISPARSGTKLCPAIHLRGMDRSWIDLSQHWEMGEQHLLRVTLDDPAEVNEEGMSGVRPYIIDDERARRLMPDLPDLDPVEGIEPIGWAMVAATTHIHYAEDRETIVRTGTPHHTVAAYALTEYGREIPYANQLANNLSCRLSYFGLWLGSSDL